MSDPLNDEFRVDFIDDDPPPATRERALPVSWLGYVVGVLESQPDRWAIVHGIPPENVPAYGNRMVERAVELGVTVEVVTRRGVLYARAAGLRGDL